MGCCSRLVGMTLHAPIMLRKLFVENFLKSFRARKRPPPLAMSDGGPVVRGDKVLWPGSRLITLSPWPCCRGGVRACVVCVYLDIVTWTGREVTITIRLPYGRYTIDASPHHGFTMPHRFWAQRKPPPSRRTMGATSNQNIFAQVDGPTAPSAFRPCFFCQRMTAALVFTP